MWTDLNPEPTKKEMYVHFQKYRVALKESPSLSFSFFSREDTRKFGASMDPYIINIYKEALPHIPNNEVVGIDVETIGLNGIIHGIGIFYSESGECFYLYFPQSVDKESKDRVSLFLKELGRKNRLVQYSTYDSINIYLSLGIFLEIEDVALLNYCLDSNNVYKKLSELSKDYLGRIPESYEGVLSKYRASDLSQVPTETVAAYCGEDAAEVVWLYKILKGKAKELGTWDLYEKEKEIPFTITLSKVWGVRIDKYRIPKLKERMEKRRRNIEKNIRNISPLSKDDSLYLSRADWLRWFLFEKCRFPTDSVRVTKGGTLSTDSATLTNLSDLSSIPGYILEWRKLFDLDSKFLSSFESFMNGDRIHPNFNYTSTLTGRFSSSNPNLQQIPNPGKGEEFKEIRNLIIPSEGYILVSADYPSIELRILAFLSDCMFLKNIYISGEDLHNKIACSIFGIDESKFSRKLDEHEKCRRLAKNINYGIVYGLSEYRLNNIMQSLGIESSLDKARELLDNYWNTIPEVNVFLSKKKLEAFSKREIRTYQGRRRVVFQNQKAATYYYNLASQGTYSWYQAYKASAAYFKPSDRATARQLGNYLVQAHCSDSLRWAIAEYYRRSSPEWREKCRLLISVHDEIVMEVKRNRIEEGKRFLKRLLEDAIPLGEIPVEVSPQTADQWGECK